MSGRVKAERREINGTDGILCYDRTHLKRMSRIAGKRWKRLSGMHGRNSERCFELSIRFNRVLAKQKGSRFL